MLPHHEPADLIRSARLVILDPDHRVLLFRYVEAHRPPFWSTAGGRLEPGEDFRAAAERELREETGFGVQVGRLLHTREEAGYLEQYFLVQCSGGAPDGAGWTDDERSIILEHRWWSSNELHETSERFLPESLPVLLIEWCG